MGSLEQLSVFYPHVPKKTIDEALLQFEGNTSSCLEKLDQLEKKYKAALTPSNRSPTTVAVLILLPSISTLCEWMSLPIQSLNVTHCQVGDFYYAKIISIPKVRP